MFGAYFSCFPGAGSFTRTVVNYCAGAKTRLAGVPSGFLVLLQILFKPFIKYLPNAGLAGVLMVVACSMIDKRENLLS
ncbi:SulP family inorganic anion transporter [Desulfotruncus alcoholivorax]|uniref:SulP family inorganic anion transporter n=1 Tax=Desulfotruncus alcoholivorax TaxID=265477 RepID=UPI00040D257C|nr:SulP family inorganic anion transporter [Desulfotruncus alcoholivorax]